MLDNIDKSAAGRASGEARRKVDLGLSRIELKTPQHALQLLEIITGSTLTGKLDVKKGTGIASIIRVFNEIYKNHIQDEKIKELEDRLEAANI